MHKKILPRHGFRLVFDYYQAIRSNDLQKVKQLFTELEEGKLKGMNLKNYIINHESPLTIAIASGSSEVALFLVNELDIALGNPPPLHQSVIHQNHQVFRELIKMEAPLDQKDSNWMTALHHAARLGLKDYVVELVEKGARLNVANNVGFSPLDEALRGGHAELSAWLKWKGTAAA